MADIPIINTKGEKIGKFALKGESDARIKKGLLYQVSTNYMANRHRGTHKTKTRSGVRGGGVKPWRQKGTGRARVGSSRNPVWRGGGVAFGPQVRSYSYSVPRKARKLALAEAIRSKIKSEKLVVFDKIDIKEPKTKKMVAVIGALKLGRKAIMIMEAVDKNIKLASRNIPNFEVKQRLNTNALDILKYEKVAIAKDSLKSILSSESEK